MLGGIWGCILFKLKEYTPRPPKKNSGGVSIPPPAPSYDQRKGCGPSFGNHPGGWTGERGLRGTVGRGTGVRSGVLAAIQGVLPCGGRGWGRLGSFGAGIGWLLPCEGTGAARRGRRALRVGAGRLHQPPWTGFAAGAAWRPGGWWGPPVGEDSRMGAFVPVLRPREIPRRGRAPSWFPALAAERMKSFFPATCAAGKILLTERSVGAPPFGGTPAPERSAHPIVRPAKGRAHRVGGI